MMRWGFQGTHDRPKSHGSAAAESERASPGEGSAFDFFVPAPERFRSSCTWSAARAVALFSRHFTSLSSQCRAATGLKRSSSDGGRYRPLNSI